jgi:hypothetical protein
MQALIDEAYRRLDSLRGEVRESVQADLRMGDISPDLITQFNTLNHWLSEPRTLDNLNNILTILSAADETVDTHYNEWTELEIKRYREISELDAQHVYALRQNLSLRPQTSASAGEQKHAHSMFRTLVIKY